MAHRHPSAAARNSRRRHTATARGTGRRCSPPPRRRLPRRLLRREAPTTVALLPDERAFATMRRYRSFRFDHYGAYRRATAGLLRTLAARTEHVQVTLLDPQDYADYCTTTGTNPDTAAARARYTADRQRRVLTYRGQRLTELVNRLRAVEATRPADTGAPSPQRPDKPKRPPSALTPD
ncbi:hypothetical protein GL263_24955, partial [Streptomyces durbertensis]|nr:hypothetical protein [Streptomyces durbertensis]